MTSYLVRREVLKLDKKLGEDLRHFVHELLHEHVGIFERNTLMSVAEVERILEELFVVCAEVKADGNS